MKVSEWLEYKYNFNIRFRDTDSYGVIHHSNYFCYFEEARYSFAIETLKLFDENANVNSIKFPVLEACCVYKNALTYDNNNYYVHLKFRTLDNSKLEFKYEIKNELTSKIYAYGTTVHVILNENDKLCLQIPKWLDDVIKGGRYEK